MKTGVPTPHRKDSIGPESRIDTFHRPPASHEQTGTSQQHERQREFGHYEGATYPAGGHPVRNPSPPFLGGGPQVPAPEHRCRGQSYQNARESGDRQRPAEDAQIEAGLVQTRQVDTLDGADDANACQSEQNPDKAGDNGEHYTLRQELPNDAQATRSERRANGHFPRAADTPRQREARDVRRCDQKNTGNRGDEQPQ